MNIYDRCGLLHALAVLAPLAPPDDPASLMRALRLEDPSADSVAAEQELVLAQVRDRLLQQRIAVLMRVRAHKSYKTSAVVTGPQY